MIAKHQLSWFWLFFFWNFSVYLWKLYTKSTSESNVMRISRFKYANVLHASWIRCKKKCKILITFDLGDDYLKYSLKFQKMIRITHPTPECAGENCLQFPKMVDNTCDGISIKYALFVWIYVICRYFVHLKLFIA